MFIKTKAMNKEKSLASGEKLRYRFDLPKATSHIFLDKLCLLISR